VLLDQQDDEHRNADVLQKLRCLFSATRRRREDAVRLNEFKAIRAQRRWHWHTVLGELGDQLTQRKIGIIPAVAGPHAKLGQVKWIPKSESLKQLAEHDATAARL
jgi:hypothetical protein